MLLKAKKIYSEFIDKNQTGSNESTENRPEGAPWDQWEILKEPEVRLKKEERWRNLESVHTHTLFYLAQTTKSTGNDQLSAQYCGLCLERQLVSRV